MCLSMWNSKDKNKKIIGCIVAVVVVFALGLCVGSYCFGGAKKKIKFEAKNISFYTVKKMIGIEMSSKERAVVDIFKDNVNKCIDQNLNKEELEVLLNIKNEVLKLSNNNNKVVFRIKDLNAGKKDKKKAVKVAKKVLKCNRSGKKVMSKAEKKLFNSGFAKMGLKDKIELFNAIK